ncbi:UNVERIFIED_CONTAM: hypothetical protein Sradi_3960500 [Sesamum radiatum]|uniref:Reverse transcriptase zinc-binding domain-containing protein n=1 Tax=Sesamum radiatum TaxID=300843 RepID=A0AAW2PKS8_SESRA
MEARHDVYLGLSRMSNKSKTELFANIRERVCAKTVGWKERYLSQAGKLTLIKSVLQAIPSYIMSCFRIPITLLSEMNRHMASFFWDSGKNHKIHWLRWGKMCKRMNDGGLGQRDLHSFNMALLAKQGWRLMTRPEALLSRILTARYYPNSNFCEAKKKANASFTRQSLLAAQSLVMMGSRWRIGDGANVRIWHDRWIPREFSFMTLTTPIVLSPNAKVSELIDEGGQEWKSELINLIFPANEAEVILSIPLGRSTPDRLQGSTCYQAKDDSWEFVWQCDAPPKVKMFIWRACKRIIPTAINLRARHCLEDTRCARCEETDEDDHHALLVCPFARMTWALSNIQWHLLDS